MPRRIHVPSPLRTGTITLNQNQAHHLRDVLRAKTGNAIEAFDDQGNIADAIVEQCEPDHVTVRVEQIRAAQSSLHITIASAIPKGERADWMIEKLSELGVSRFIPLAAKRSVVLPKGKGKHERWQRIATESAKQSRRSGVMRIDELTSLAKIIEEQRDEGRGQKNTQSISARFYLSTESDVVPILSSISALIPLPSALTFFIGPEGGWTDDELERFTNSGLTGLKLTATILRVETAAIATAAIVAAQVAANDSAKKT